MLQHYDYKYGVYNATTNSVNETKNNGQIARVEGTIATQKQWQQNFTYDSIGRLATAREFHGVSNERSYLINYDYDPFGNRRQKQEDNSSNPFTQTWTEASDIAPATNRLAASTGVSYDYSGNVEIDPKYRHLKFEYDANNRQKQSSNLDDTDVVKSVYDATGQRVATQVAGALTNVLVYDAMGKLVAEYGNSSSANGTQYVMADHQGSTRAVLNNAGTVVSRHDYLPFGEEVYAGVGMRSPGQGFNVADSVRQKYAGMETDDVTGMAHTLWRQYDALSGRWTAPDPYGGSMTVADPQSFNRYSYVNNDPVNQVDPSGLMGMLLDATTTWSQVSDDFWGKRSLMNRPVRSGLGIIQTRAQDVRFTVRSYSRYDEEKGILHSYTDLVYQGNHSLTKLFLQYTPTPYLGPERPPTNRHAGPNRDSFRRINFPIGLMTSGSITHDKNGNWYFSIGLSAGKGPVPFSIVGGTTYDENGQPAYNEKDVQRILTGPSANYQGGAGLILGGSENISTFGLISPAIPNGTGSTREMGLGFPQVGYGKGVTTRIPWLKF